MSMRVMMKRARGVTMFFTQDVGGRRVSVRYIRGASTYDWRIDGQDVKKSDVTALFAKSPPPDRRIGGRR